MSSGGTTDFRAQGLWPPQLSHRYTTPYWPRPSSRPSFGFPVRKNKQKKPKKKSWLGLGNGLRGGRSVRFGVSDVTETQPRPGPAGSPRRDSLTVQQHIPQGAALQGQARQPGGVVLPHTQPQVLGALQPARVSLLQLQTANTQLHRSGFRTQAGCFLSFTGSLLWNL